MSQPKGEDREAPHSLAPIQLEGAADENDLAKLRGGRGIRLAITLMVAAGAVAGGAQLLRMMDTRQAYAVAASALERLDTEKRDPFIRCALPSYQRSQIANSNALRGAIESATDRMGRSYGRLLAKCAPLLENFQQAAADIKAPDDVSDDVSAVTNATSALGQAFKDYQAMLLRPEQDYDNAQVLPMIEAIGSAWDTYQKAREQAKHAMTERM